ncbi:hypothetical protein MJO29_014797 [Puccinia striiformis f. sp. tritici]|uniref:uncharacterized protein n=1 Tax=Puccinia striiformis f. sp. tritici TaxID=168172 RepID=UPI002008C898|nr:uncharacterized protein Pst134EA_031960 [Puccinia striiformis f. sp. tritici]XP_047798767.1 hypothetical protein Pst134EA_027886 [Puccinia striiformis f. sp. tritici]KAH9444418.1 hypothetical protein Pst134EA_031960 [Puccinia striiformis f. sp. tritici]KAH9448577.1 hypothetical protein Pst134EA_027886 [Puccinia striiformis f. sp. tritici]KAI7937482.1 hypothetical protein MJO29_014797 [Puccinia striiformis f. sp. tritici]
MFGIQWSESFNQRTRRISGANLIYISLFVATCLLTPIESSRSNKWNLKRGYFRKYPQATRRQEIITELAPTLLNPITSAILPTNQSESNWGSTHFNFPNPVDTLPDFSYAGYRSGNVPIPWTDNNTMIISPTNESDDRTFEIQTAIDSLAGKPGVIQFEAGTYLLSSNNSIRLPSFVVLRGESSTPSATVLRVSGPPRNLFEIGDPKASGSLRPEEGMSRMNQDYVGVGAKSVEVEDASQFKIGQSIVLHRLVTKSWNDAMNMSSLVRNGKPQIWLAPNTAVNQEREITVISGNRIMWEVPLTDSINVALSENTASVVAYQAPVRVQQAGIENLVLTQVPDSSSLVVGTPTILPIKIGGAEDCWISNIQATGFIEFSYLTQPSRRITLSDFVIIRDVPTSNGGTGALPLDITMAGSQALLLRGKTIGAENTASYIVSTGRLAAGPNVVSGYIATGSKKHMIEPHQRWSTGFLVEDSHVGQINLKNRGIMGTGHGWAIGSGVVWSCSATKITIENPPMSRNFQVNSEVVANFRNFQPTNQGNPANSLYQMQLSARIGAEAAALVFRPPSPSATQPSNTAQPTESIPDTVPDAQGQSKSQVPDDLVSGLLGVL